MPEVRLDYIPQPRQMLLHSTKARQILYGGAAGGGKQLAVDTWIPTATGGKPIGDLEVGDVVFASDGTPTPVVWVSEPEVPVECFEVVFDTGEVILADARHPWVTMTDAERLAALRLTDEWRSRRRGGRLSRAKPVSQKPLVSRSITRINREREHTCLLPPEGAVRTTEEIRETLRVRGRTNHSVRVGGALDLPSARLPIDPYVLGLWLGDGQTAVGVIGMAQEDWAFLLPLCGETPLWRRVETRCRNLPFENIRFESLTARLRALGLRGDKRIPSMYLRSSRNQRLALFQGLMDTDGTCDKRGQCEILLSKRDLLDDVWELASSLGIKATVREKKVRGYKSAWRIKFVAPFPVFRLPRKADRQKMAGLRPTTLRRFIVDVRPVKSRLMRCIQVAHPSHTYLVGRSFIPTHNSHSLRWDAIMFCLHNPGCQAYLFRKSRTELEATHIAKIRVDLGGKGLGTYSETRKAFEFANGSVLWFCYCEREGDVETYLSEEMHWLGVDEASRMDPRVLGFLITRVRLGGWSPARDRDRLPRIAFASNPGGPSHAYLKSKFIEPAPAETVFHDREMRDPSNPEDLGWTTVYIPAKMQDNRHLDADYGASFGALSPELAKAYREGDWDAVVGQALHTLSRERHQLRSFVPPKHWTRFMVIDWGTASPFSIGWYCVSEGAELAGREGWPARWLPPGAVIRYDEWYGWNGRANQGARLSPQEVAKGIIDRENERRDTMDFRVGDNEMWADRGGPSIQEKFQEVDPRLVMKKSLKDRKRNYQEVLARLSGNPEYFSTGDVEDDPMFFVTANCIHFWRTVPPLTLDEIDPEKGPDSKQEDHVYDEVAYGLRSRPYVTTEDDRFEAQYGEEMRRARGAVMDPYAT